MILVTVLLFPAFGFAAAALGARAFIRFERRHHAPEIDYNAELLALVERERLVAAA
jgi:hypothetical protein